VLVEGVLAICSLVAFVIGLGALVLIEAVANLIIFIASRTRSRRLEAISVRCALVADVSEVAELFFLLRTLTPFRERGSERDS